MRVFGCMAYSRVPDPLRTKLDNKGIKCRFIGYTENGYRLWQEDKNKSVHSRNVIFDENNFVCEKKANIEQNYIKETVDDEENNDQDSENRTRIMLPKIARMKNQKVRISPKKKIMDRLIQDQKGIENYHKDLMIMMLKWAV